LAAVHEWTAVMAAETSCSPRCASTPRANAETPTRCARAAPTWGDLRGRAPTWGSGRRTPRRVAHHDEARVRSRLRTKIRGPAYEFGPSNLPQGRVTATPTGNASAKPLRLPVASLGGRHACGPRGAVSPSESRALSLARQLLPGDGGRRDGAQPQ